MPPLWFPKVSHSDFQIKTWGKGPNKGPSREPLPGDSSGFCLPDAEKVEALLCKSVHVLLTHHSQLGNTGTWDMFQRILEERQAGSAGA